jgi:hypothetical protein
MSGKVLNESLYNALLAAFGEVRIANQGMQFNATVLPNLVPGAGGRNSGYHKIKTHSAGEYYKVCCPHCGDQRYRLWINHRWGTELSGMRLDHLACCYNESCEQNQGFWTWLRKTIEGELGAVTYIRSDAVEPDELRPIPLPGVCIPLHELPTQHAAVQYIAGRGFDPVKLGTYWGVSWCTYSLETPPENRLVFPVYDYYDDKLCTMAWQARWLDTATLNDAPPKGQKKYYNQTGHPLHRFLYNAYRARDQRDIVVVCEGALDAIRVGRSRGVALFGKTASEEQKSVLWRKWGRHGAVGVVAIDPDATRERNRLAKWMESWRKSIVLDFPHGQDVAATPKDVIWGTINARL